MNPFRRMVTVGHNARVFVWHKRPTEREEMAKRRSQGDMECDAWYWRRARSNLPPGYLWQLWRSASTLPEPFRPDRNVLCWCCFSVHPTSLCEDVLGGCDRECLEMHFETEIEWTPRCIVLRGSSEWRDTCGGQDRVNPGLHLEAVIERDWRCTSMPLSCELGGHNQASLEMHL